ncbi:hypothetical protein BKA82DRAFT_4130593 [Pisolithus tinctorius]|nr:hypothetical protein BKA82DRAFT_4130593 [Pisolithus tinctorius]
MINGVVSSPDVTHSVWQGNPLQACLLFDIIINPLACLLSHSPMLKGFNIPGMNEKLVVSLYADDMMMYLSKSNSCRPPHSADEIVTNLGVGHNFLGHQQTSSPLDSTGQHWPEVPLP